MYIFYEHASDRRGLKCMLGVHDRIKQLIHASSHTAGKGKEKCRVCISGCERSDNIWSCSTVLSVIENSSL